MKTNIRIFLLCSVPEDQKPIQEYLAFQENSFLNWITLSKKKYKKKLANLTCGSFVGVIFLRFLFSPLKPFTQGMEQLWNQYLIIFPQIFQQEFSDWFVQTFFWSNIGFCLFLLTIFFRCREIQLHFFEPRLIYEEASWYDGQIWEKPFPLLKNDRLLSTQRLEPLLKRLLGTLSFFLISETVFSLFIF